MTSSSRRVVAAWGAVAAALLVWSAVAHLGRSMAPGTAQPVTGTSSLLAATPALEGAPVHLAGSLSSSRAAVPPAENAGGETNAVARAATTGDVVHVSGRLLRGGLSVEDFELVFRPAGPNGSEVDWDFTDEEGCFEVDLSAASYLVSSEDYPAWTLALDVPAGADTWACDIELPTR